MPNFSKTTLSLVTDHYIVVSLVWLCFFYRSARWHKRRSALAEPKPAEPRDFTVKSIVICASSLPRAVTVFTVYAFSSAAFVLSGPSASTVVTNIEGSTATVPVTGAEHVLLLYRYTVRRGMTDGHAAIFG